MIAHLGAICELVRGKVDLAKRALPDEPAQGIVSNRLEFFTREFAAETAVSGMRIDG